MAAPEAIFAASVKQLKRLIKVYAVGHDSASFSIFWHSALLYVANAVLKYTSSPDWHFYFLVCIQGYLRLFRSFQVAEGIVQGLLAKALGSRAITKEEAVSLTEGVRSPNSRLKLAQKTNGPPMVDLDLALTDREAAAVGVMVDKFERITMFDEFTNGL